MPLTKANSLFCCVSDTVNTTTNEQTNPNLVSGFRCRNYNIEVWLHHVPLICLDALFWAKFYKQRRSMMIFSVSVV